MPLISSEVSAALGEQPPPLPGAPLPAQFPCLFGGVESTEGSAAFLPAAGISHDFTTL